MNDLFISIEYNNREFEGIPEFKDILDKEYNYQIRPEFISAAAEGCEMWITIFVNSEIKDFLFAAVTGGLLWDIIKSGGRKYILKPLINALEQLDTANKTFGGLRIQKLKLQFDNCEIIIGGLNKNFTSILSSIFQNVAKMKPKFESDNSNQEVIKIELPIIHNSGIDKRGYSPYLLDSLNEDYTIQVYNRKWKLTFSTNFPVLIYDFNTDEYSDGYPNK